MLKHVKKLLLPFLVIFISIMLGYVLRMYHEGKLRTHYQSQAERELSTLEEEFHSAWKKPRKFYIFNGRFEVYPLRESDRTFYYNEVKDTGLHDQETKSSGSVKEKKQEQKKF